MYQKSTVGTLVACLLAYNFLVSLCNGACYGREARLSSLGERPDGCIDEDIKRELNSTWFKEECIRCTCDSDGEINCCNRVLKPYLYDQDCEATLNTTSCTYTFRRTDNSDEPCDSLAFM